MRLISTPSKTHQSPSIHGKTQSMQNGYRRGHPGGSRTTSKSTENSPSTFFLTNAGITQSRFLPSLRRNVPKAFHAGRIQFGAARTKENCASISINALNWTQVDFGKLQGVFADLNSNGQEKRRFTEAYVGVSSAAVHRPPFRENASSRSGNLLHIR